MSIITILALKKMKKGEVVDLRVMKPEYGYDAAGTANGVTSDSKIIGQVI